MLHFQDGVSSKPISVLFHILNWHYLKIKISQIENNHIPMPVGVSLWSINSDVSASVVWCLEFSISNVDDRPDLVGWVMSPSTPRFCCCIVICMQKFQNEKKSISSHHPWKWSNIKQPSLVTFTPIWLKRRLFDDTHGYTETKRFRYLLYRVLIFPCSLLDQQLLSEFAWKTCLFIWLIP